MRYDRDERSDVLSRQEFNAMMLSTSPARFLGRLNVAIICALGGIFLLSWFLALPLRMMADARFLEQHLLAGVGALLGVAGTTVWICWGLEMRGQAHAVMYRMGHGALAVASLAVGTGLAWSVAAPANKEDDIWAWMVLMLEVAPPAGLLALAGLALMFCAPARAERPRATAGLPPAA